MLATHITVNAATMMISPISPWVKFGLTRSTSKIIKMKGVNNVIVAIATAVCVEALNVLGLFVFVYTAKSIPLSKKKKLNNSKAIFDTPNHKSIIGPSKNTNKISRTAASSSGYCFSV